MPSIPLGQIETKGLPSACSTSSQQKRPVVLTQQAARAVQGLLNWGPWSSQGSLHSASCTGRRMHSPLAAACQDALPCRADPVSSWCSISWLGRLVFCARAHHLQPLQECACGTASHASACAFTTRWPVFHPIWTLRECSPELPAPAELGEVCAQQQVVCPDAAPAAPTLCAALSGGCPRLRG